MPVIALTAGAMAEERQKALEAGINDFLAKPMDISQLIEKIKAHIAPQGKLESVEQGSP